MKGRFKYLLMVGLILALSSSSQAQFPCWPGDSVGTNCCGADSGCPIGDSCGYSLDLGICDTLHIVPWPNTDTCFAGDCVNYKINIPGESFPCFLYVNVFVSHDSSTFWWDDDSSWIQDSIKAFVVPQIFWHQPVSGMDADSVIFPFESNSWNNTWINPYVPYMNRSMFRHFVDSRTGDTTYNRMLQMVEAGKTAWNVYTDIESHSFPGDSGHVYFAVTPMSPNCQRWWEGSRVLLATLTFQVYMPEGSDTTEICIDSTLWPPTSNLTFGRQDAKIYVPRHFLPICFKVSGDTVWTGVRWIEGFADEESKPTTFSVSQNYPNPFNPVTTIRFKVEGGRSKVPIPITLKVYNILGQLVKILVDEEKLPGTYQVVWDGNDDRGVEVSSGIYFYRIMAGDFSDIKKMILLK